MIIYGMQRPIIEKIIITEFQTIILENKNSDT